jgi:hypothetical protein
MAAITSGQGVLLPDSTRSKRKQRAVTVAVNSRDRNLGSDYNPNSFRWTFRRPLKDVLSIELVNGSVPAALYNINTGWNKFTFGEGNTKWAVTLTPGQYTPAQLADELQTQLNALAGVINTYAVGYDINSMRIKITATGFGGNPAVSYTLYFMTSPYADSIDNRTGATMSINCPGRLLGFEWQDYTSAGGAIQPPNRMDVDLFLKKIYLYINADNSVELNRVEMGAGRKDCFHIIYMDEVINGYYSLNKDLHTPIFYSSPAPISRIGTLNISLRDEFHRLIDVGWQDFTLLFEITYLE